MAKDRKDLTAYAIIAAILLLLAYPALTWLIRSWLSNPYYSHGFLIPPIVALLLWRLGRHARQEPRQGQTWAGLALTVASLALVIRTLRWQNYVLTWGALIGLLIGILLYLEGWLRLKHWLFPLLFLALMVPLPFIDLASPWLESFTAQTAATLARAVGISAVQQGGEITLPNTTVVVGAPCSGLRSLVAMVTLAIGWVYLVKGRLIAKLIMLLAIVPLVALSNVLRVAILLVVAQVWSAEAALTYYHDWSSPVLFLMALGLLLILGKILGCNQIRDDIF